MEIVDSVSLHLERLKENIAFVNDVMAAQNLSWTFSIKLLKGISAEPIQELSQTMAQSMASDDLEHLKIIKTINPKIETWFFNYEGITVDSSHVDVDLTHNLSGPPETTCYMLLLDENRLGIEFRDYLKSEKLQSSQRIGAYLDCTTAPDVKLLERWKALNLNPDVLQSLGTSVSWANKKRFIDMGVNHFRLGEIIFFGKDILTDKPIKGLRIDVFGSKKTVSYHHVSKLIQNK